MPYYQGQISGGALPKDWLDTLQTHLLAAGWIMLDNQFTSAVASSGYRIYEPAGLGNQNGTLEIFVGGTETRLRVHKTWNTGTLTSDARSEYAIRVHDLASGFNYFLNAEGWNLQMAFETVAGVTNTFGAFIREPNSFEPQFTNLNVAKIRAAVWQLGNYAHNNFDNSASEFEFFSCSHAYAQVNQRTEASLGYVLKSGDLTEFVSIFGNVTWGRFIYRGARHTPIWNGANMVLSHSIETGYFQILDVSDASLHALRCTHNKLPIWHTNKVGADDLYMLCIAEDQTRPALLPAKTLTTAINATDTTITVTGDVSSFPAANGTFRLGLLEGGGEWVKYTTRTGNTFTGCTRGTDTSTAASWGVGTRVRLAEWWLKAKSTAMRVGFQLP
jgi:hypothetical protein